MEIEIGENLKFVLAALFIAPSAAYAVGQFFKALK